VLAENEKRFKVHVAAGDMTSRALGGIEALVNTENDYMQMARIFESSTLSSSIRREGAHFNMGRLQEDTVQKMLDAKVEELLDETCGRPLMLGEVLYTPAGHALSDLRKNGARYILHAATVRVESITMRDQLRAIETSTGIERTIFNCFEAVKEIDANKGVICPPPWQEEQEKAKGSYQNIESIIFPVFGTGHGGRSVTEVLPEMARAIRDYLMDHADDNEFHIKDVYLCVYAAPDVDDAIWAFSERRGFKCIAGDCATGKTADKKEPARQNGGKAG
jgi:O-acetyl-ADP-ribose deacetylase (regulator of RNase III)